MRQVLFTIPIFGGLKVFGYGTMLVLAFVSSTWLAYWRAERERLDPEVIGDMSFWVFLFGLIGARLFYCIEYWGDEIKSLWDVVQYWKGGIVYYGGIVGGVAAFFVYRRLRPFPLRPYMDVLAPSIAIGTLFGRLGCFLNGCCFGDICQLPWAVSFPAIRLPGSSIVQLGLIRAECAHTRCRSTPPSSTRRSTRLVLFLLLDGVFSAPPARRRGHRALDADLSDLAVRDRVSAERRGCVLRRHDDLADHQRGALFLGGCAYWAWLSTLPQGALSRSSARGERAAKRRCRWRRLRS